MKNISNSKTIAEFFKLTNKLKELEIIRSSKIIGDIGEYLCECILDLKLCDNQRTIGYDAIDKNGIKYQIKINNSSEKTNQDIGNPNKYDQLVLIITRNSKLFINNNKNIFMTIYQISSKDLKNKKYIAKKEIEKIKPLLNLNEELMILKL